MEAPNPARLYATLVGGLLMTFGIVGFFYSSSFGSPGATSEVLGLFEVNGWYNVTHIVIGAIGLLVAGYAARPYAFWVGALYIAVGTWGLIANGGEAIFDLLPTGDGNDSLHLALGVLGVCAALSTPRRSLGKPPARSGRAARAT